MELATRRSLPLDWWWLDLSLTLVGVSDLESSWPLFGTLEGAIDRYR